MREQIDVFRSMAPHIYNREWFTYSPNLEIKKLDDYCWWGYNPERDVWMLTTEPSGMMGITFWMNAAIVPLQDAIRKFKEESEEFLNKIPDVVLRFQ